MSDCDAVEASTDSAMPVNRNHSGAGKACALTGSVEGMKQDVCCLMRSGMSVLRDHMCIFL